MVNSLPSTVTSRPDLSTPGISISTRNSLSVAEMLAGGVTKARLRSTRAFWFCVSATVFIIFSLYRRTHACPRRQFVLLSGLDFDLFAFGLLGSIQRDREHPVLVGRLNFV